MRLMLAIAAILTLAVPSPAQWSYCSARAKIPSCPCGADPAKCVCPSGQCSCWGPYGWDCHKSPIVPPKVHCYCNGDPTACTCTPGACQCAAGGECRTAKTGMYSATLTTYREFGPGLIGGQFAGAQVQLFAPLPAGTYQVQLLNGQRYDTTTVYRDPITNRRWRYVDQTGATVWLDPEPTAYPVYYQEPTFTSPVPLLQRGFRGRGASGCSS